MKIAKTLLFLTFVISSSQAMEQPPRKSYKYFEQESVSVDELIQNNMVDPGTKKILDEKIHQATRIQPDQLPANIAQVLRRYWGATLSTFILKEHNIIIKRQESDCIGASRIWGAQLINQCARAHKLSIRAPEKRCYRQDSCLWIVAPLIEPSAKPFEPRQIKDIYKLAKLTGYFGDLNAANIFNTEEGISYAIDTEEKSFVDCDIIEVLVPDVRQRFSTFALEGQARQWINQKLTKLEARQEMISHFNLLPFSAPLTRLLGTPAE